MAATAVRRQAFGEVGAARLQHFLSAKNCQNAITEMLASPDMGKSTFKKPFKTRFTIKPVAMKPVTAITLKPATKRSYTPEATDLHEFSDEDIENFDPGVFSPKRTKTNASTSTASSYTNPNTTFKKPFKAPIIGGRIIPPPHDPPFGAATAPAGRSPINKRFGLLSSSRNSLAPAWKRVNPPSSAMTGPCLSINEAIRASIDSLKKPAFVGKNKPKGWYFKVHQDTPDEAASVVLQHETGVMDLSSDDQAVMKEKAIEARGKENIPPPGHVDFNPVGGAKVRRSIVAGPLAGMDLKRMPLGALAACAYYGPGLNDASVHLVPAEEEVDVVVKTTAASPSIGYSPVATGLNSPVAEDEEEEL